MINCLDIFHLVTSGESAMTTNSVSRVSIRNVATSVMIIAIAVAAGSMVLTRTAAADGGSLAGDGNSIVRDGVVTQLTPTEPDGNTIDPGSLSRVDRYVNDSIGQTYRQTGYRWTSLGVPRNNLTLTSMTTYAEAPDPVEVVCSAPEIQYYASYPSYWSDFHGHHDHHDHHAHHDHHDHHDHHAHHDHHDHHASHGGHHHH
jgi:hypothetical protein